MNISFNGPLGAVIGGIILVVALVVTISGAAAVLWFLYYWWCEVLYKFNVLKSERHSFWYFIQHKKEIIKYVDENELK